MPTVAGVIECSMAAGSMVKVLSSVSQKTTFAPAWVIIAEVLFTALFVLVIIGVTRSSMPAGFAAIPIGLMLTLVHLISIPIDNTSVNPVRSFSTAIFADGFAFEQLWVFIVFPIVGGVIAALVWSLLGPEDSVLTPAPTKAPAKTASRATKKTAKTR